MTLRIPGRIAAVVLAGTVVVSATMALAQDPIAEMLARGGSGTEWSDGFDVASVGARDANTSVPTMSPQIVDALRGAITRYSDIVARGGWPMVPSDKVLKIGMRDNAVAIMRQRLTISGDLPPATGSRPDAFDTYVEAAVKRFQARHGLVADGVVGKSTFEAMNIPATVRLNQLSNNLPRLKSLTDNLPTRYVMVNIPAAAIEAVDDGRVELRHTAIVGKIDRQTPILNSKIYEVNFNPFWTMPKSIIQKDLIPMMREQPNYLTEQHIRIYSQKGDELQPQQIDWNTDDAVNYMFRQEPGDFNAMGQVRINFHNKHAVYMHDTPNKGLFREETRFFSSGCVRVQNVRDFVAWLAEDNEGFDRSSVDYMYRSGERYDLKLANPVPVYFTYITAWAVTDGVVQFRNDIYNLDGLQQYSAAGVIREL